MDWLSDNHVWLSAAIVGLIILVALTILAVVGLRLWRSTKAALTSVSAAGETLAAEADRLQAAADALPERQAELQRSLVDLQGRAAMLAVLAGAMGDLASTLRAPRRYRM